MQDAMAKEIVEDKSIDMKLVVRDVGERERRWMAAS
jgi:hypothetical protein